MNDLRDWADPCRDRDEPPLPYVVWDGPRGVIRNGRYVGHWVKIIVNSCTLIGSPCRNHAAVTSTAKLLLFDRDWMQITQDSVEVKYDPPDGVAPPNFKESEQHKRLLDLADERATKAVKEKFEKWISL